MRFKVFAHYKFLSYEKKDYLCIVVGAYVADSH